MLFHNQIEVFRSEADSLKILLGSEHILDARPLSGSSLIEKHRLAIEHEVRSVLECSASSWCSSIDQWAAECSALSAPPDDAVDIDGAEGIRDEDEDDDDGVDVPYPVPSRGTAPGAQKGRSPVTAAQTTNTSRAIAGSSITPPPTRAQTSVSSQPLRPAVTSKDSQPLCPTPSFGTISSTSACAASNNNSSSNSKPLQSPRTFPPLTSSHSLSPLNTTPAAVSHLRHPNTGTQPLVAGSNSSTQPSQPHPSSLVAPRATSGRFPAPRWKSTSNDGAVPTPATTSTCRNSARTVALADSSPAAASATTSAQPVSPPATSRVSSGPPPAKRASLHFPPFRPASPLLPSASASAGASAVSIANRRSEPLSHRPFDTDRHAVAGAAPGAQSNPISTMPLRPPLSSGTQEAETDGTNSLYCMNDEQLDALVASVEVPADVKET